VDFALSDEQRALQEAAREFARNELAAGVRDRDTNEGIPSELIQRAAALGFLGGTLPPEYGGAGLDHLSYALVLEEIARVDHAFAALVSFPSGVAGSGILRYGSQALKERYLTGFAQGTSLGAAGVTEPGSGSDVAGLKTTVDRNGDGYTLRGAKAWISNLDHADWFLTFARLNGSSKRDGICAFVVEKSWGGVVTAPVRNKTGFRPLATGELAFDDVHVPAENLVGEEGQGFAVAMCAVENGRLAVSARACGVIAACLDECLRYARERETFGKRIGEYQLVQSKIADMIVGLESSRLLTYRLAWLKDAGHDRLRRDASIAKLHATEVLMRTAVDAAQIFGAYSCSPEYEVGRHFRDAKFFQIVEGANDLHRLLIAEDALALRAR
jgi:alkylation response protein AidB-like acyl-CoA dehydrogenase